MDKLVRVTRIPHQRAKTEYTFDSLEDAVKCTFDMAVKDGWSFEAESDNDEESTDVDSGKELLECIERRHDRFMVRRGDCSAEEVEYYRDGEAFLRDFYGHDGQTPIIEFSEGGLFEAERNRVYELIPSSDRGLGTRLFSLYTAREFVAIYHVLDVLNDVASAAEAELESDYLELLGYLRERLIGGERYFYVRWAQKL